MCRVCVLQSLQQQLFAVDRCRTPTLPVWIHFSSSHKADQNFRCYSCCWRVIYLLSGRKPCSVPPFCCIIPRAFLLLFLLQSHSKSCWCIANEMVAFGGEGHWETGGCACCCSHCKAKCCSWCATHFRAEKNFNTSCCSILSPLRAFLYQECVSDHRFGYLLLQTNRGHW